MVDLEGDEVTSSNHVDVYKARVAVVIPTLGDRPHLRRLLLSLQEQSYPISEVCIVNQGDLRAVEKQIPPCLNFNLRVIESERGASRARRIGIESLSADWEIVALPDDDTWYASNAVEIGVAALSAGADAISGAVFTGGIDGTARVSFAETDIWLDRRTVWTSAIEAGLMLKKSFIDDVGNFDDSLGVGGSTPWQSGEGTDLLLRGLQAGKRVKFVSGLHVYEESHAPLSLSQRCARLRKYARGTGRVYSIRHSRLDRGMLVAKSVARLILGVRFASFDRSREDAAILIGRIEGLTGYTLTS